MPKRILFAGDLAPQCRPCQRFRTLRDMGFEVEGVTSSPLDYVPGVTRESFWYKVFYKLKRPLDLTGVNAKLVEAASRFQPEVVWVERALMIRPDTLAKVRQAAGERVTLVSFSEDDMFAPHNQSIYYRGCLPHYDLVFTTKSYNCDVAELPALGARRVIFVDKSYDRSAHRPIELTAAEQAHYASDVTFVGTFEEDRARQMLLLAQNGFDVRVWGNGWGGWVRRHPKLHVENAPVYNDDYLKALRAAKINLCFLRKINRDLQTDRTMELPAAGVFMLAERTPDHLRLFQEGREAAYFDVENDQELIDKVGYYLSHDDERRAVAAAGRLRAVRSGYSHHDRLAWMLAQVEELQNAAALSH